MATRVELMALMMTVLLTVSCGEKSGSDAGDSTPPAAVTDLQLIHTSTTSATIAWTARGDDGATGTAARYEVRYSTTAITEANWQAAAVAGPVPLPGAAGQSQTTAIHGLTPSTTYHFAVKSCDEATNWSALSNLTVGATPDSVGLWQSTFGGAATDEGASVAPTIGGGCVIAGSSFSLAGADHDKVAFLVKLSDSGTVVWRVALPWDYTSEANSVVATDDGGFVVAGVGAPCCNMTGPRDGYVSKVNVNGERLWTTHLGGATGDDIIYAISPARDGGYVVTGSLNGGTDLALIKLNSAGLRLWQQTLGVGGAGFAVKPAPDGGYILAGALGNLMCLIKTDEYGSRLWLRQYGYPLVTSGLALVVLGDGYLVAGSIRDGLSPYDVYLVRTDREGNRTWDQRIGGATHDWANSVVATASGDFLVFGSTNSSGAGDFDMLLLKIDGGGSVIWQRTCGGGSVDLGSGIVAARLGGYLLAGTTASYGGGGSDMYVVKVNENGEL